MFVAGRGDSLGPLSRLDIVQGSTRLTLPVMTETPRLSEDEVIPVMRAILLEHQDAPTCRDVLTLLSTTGYGRLPQALNRLDGFVDFYGHHAASGGWYLCGWTTRSWEPGDEPDEVILHFGDTQLRCDEIVAGFYQRDDLQGRGVGCVLFVRGSGRPLGPLGSVELRSAGLGSHARASGSSQRLRDSELVGRLRAILAPIAESEGGAELLALLARQPYLGVDTLASLSDPIALEFDDVIACPPGGLVLMGWMLAKPGVIRSVRLRSAQIDVPVDLEAFVKVERPDVIEALGAERGFFDTRCGFVTYVPAEIPPAAPLHIEVETSRREVGYRKLPASKLDGVAAMKRMLGTFDVRYNDIPRTYDHIIGPAVERLNARRFAIPPKADEVVFGEINPRPRFSIIIPLYGRLDFVEYQMAFFSTYAPMFDYEFIYVLDDPPKRREALRLFDSTYNRFGIPFRAVLMEQNMGFAPANNVGLRYAHGTYLCFLNSDVFPGTEDWLERLAARLEANPDLGAVGPMLLYADGLTDIARQRLMTLRDTEDGFVIADEDFRLRGAGDALGTRQSGLPGFRVADPHAQSDLLRMAAQDAQLLLHRDPDLASDRGRAARLLLNLFDLDDAARTLESG
ncbi:MAG: glycosyltransferase [Rhodospirillales bacterium]|nr:glycosyltransferase [Rhodospirillales bacterium]